MSDFSAAFKSWFTKVIPAPLMIRLRAIRFQKLGEPEIKWLDRLVDPGKAAYDIGANLGVYTYFLLQNTKEVHCFEPNPDLQRNLRATFGKKIHLHPFALSNESGIATLRFPILNGTRYHGWGSLEKNFSDESEVISHEVNIKVLDEQKLPPVGFIKIDVEGHERAVLEGANRILKEQRPRLLIEIEEQHAGEECQKTFEFLRSLQYQPSYLEGNQFKKLTPDSSGKFKLPENINMVLFTPEEEPIPA